MRAFLLFSVLFAQQAADLMYGPAFGLKCERQRASSVPRCLLAAAAVVLGAFLVAWCVRMFLSGPIRVSNVAGCVWRRGRCWMRVGVSWEVK